MWTNVGDCNPAVVEGNVYKLGMLVCKHHRYVRDRDFASTNALPVLKEGNIGFS